MNRGSSPCPPVHTQGESWLRPYNEFVVRSYPYLIRVVNKKKKTTHKGRIKHAEDLISGEVKEGVSAAMGQLTIHHDTAKGGWHIGDKARNLRPKYAKAIEDAGIIKMMNDIINVTGQKLGQWRVRYYKSPEEHDLTLANLEKLIAKNPEEYKQRFGNEEIDKMKAKAGVKVTTKAPKNDYTESLKAAAGIL